MIRGGGIQDALLGGGAIFETLNSFIQAQKARGHARGVHGMLPCIFFLKNGAIRCILEPILAFKILLFLSFCFLCCLCREV